MKRKLAILTCIVVTAAMLGACGGSGSSAPAPAAQEEETEEEAVEEEAPEAEEPEAEAPAEEAADAVEDAVEEAVEDAAEAATQAAETAEAAATAATAAAAEEVLESEEGTVQFSEVIEGKEISELLTEDEDKQLEVTEVDENDPEDKGFTMANGELYEYTAFEVGKNDAAAQYTIVYYEPTTKMLTAMISVLQVQKSAGYTEADLRSLDLNNFFPHIYEMPFAVYQLFDRGSYFELIIAFMGLDQDDNLELAHQYGLLITPGYSRGKKINGVSVADSIRRAGGVEMSAYDLTQAGISP